MNPDKAIKLLEKFIVDLKNPSGPFAAIYNEALKEAAYYMSANMPTDFFTNRTGALSKGLSESYYINWPIEMALTDGDKLDKYMSEHSPTRKSVWNKKSYPSYWHFLLEGWKGGYDAFVVAANAGQKFITSPFNPNLDKYENYYTFRHPGRNARDWYRFFQKDFESIINKVVNNRFPPLMKKYGLTV